MMINLIVLYCNDINDTKKFYESIGLKFCEEKHGSGPRHYSTKIGDILLELYPSKKSDNIRLGFSLKSFDEVINKHNVIEEFTRGSTKVVVIKDPDNRKVEIEKG